MSKKRYNGNYWKNKNTVIARNLEKYGQSTCEICKKSPLVKGFGDRRDIALQLEGNLMTVDHIIPIVKNGRHGTSNLQVTCYACNWNKGKE